MSMVSQPLLAQRPIAPTAAINPYPLLANKLSPGELLTHGWRAYFAVVEE